MYDIMDNKSDLQFVKTVEVDSINIPDELVGTLGGVCRTPNDTSEEVVYLYQNDNSVYVGLYDVIALVKHFDLIIN